MSPLLEMILGAFIFVQARAMKLLSAEIAGVSHATDVTTRPDQRFSFFNFPGIDLVPNLLQRVSETFSAANADGGAMNRR